MDELDDDAWFDLTIDIHPDITQMPFLPCPEMTRINERSETSVQVTEVTITTHVGTHIDAASHAVDGGKSIEAYDVNKFISPGVVHDVDAEPKGPIGVSDVESIQETLDEPEIRALLLRSGWEELLEDEAYLDHPYLTDELAAWLVERDLDLVGMDFLTPDKPPELREEGFDYPVHTTLLEADVLIAENLSNMAELAGQVVDVFSLPIRLRGADGAPARIAARARER